MIPDGQPVAVARLGVIGVNMILVGLPDTAVKESQDRVFSALSNSGLKMPRTRTTINLAPGDLRKEGAIYDLPIALGILIATGQLACEGIGRHLIAGELSLSGATRPIKGGLAMAVLARETGRKTVLLPPLAAQEAALVEGVEVYEITSLDQAARFLGGQVTLFPVAPPRRGTTIVRSEQEPDFADIKGQHAVRRAVEIAVAGGHNLIMLTPITPKAAKPARLNSTKRWLRSVGRGFPKSRDWQASDFFGRLADVPRHIPLVLLCRKSWLPDAAESLPGQKKNLKGEAEALGFRVLKIFAEVGSGQRTDFEHRTEAANFAGKMGAVLAAECVSRFIRSMDYKGRLDDPPPTDQEYYAAIRAMRRAKQLVTLLDPDSSYAEERSYQTRRGLRERGVKGGRPYAVKPGYMKARRRKLLPKVQALRAEGWSYRRIGRFLNLSFSTIRDWLERPIH